MKTKNIHKIAYLVLVALSLFMSRDTFSDSITIIDTSLVGFGPNATYTFSNMENITSVTATALSGYRCNRNRNDYSWSGNVLTVGSRCKGNFEVHGTPSSSQDEGDQGGISQVPLFLTQSVEPRVMLLMSNDHQLFIKAYTDYSDLNEDGVIDTTYNDKIDYYGYFDSYKCYEYANSRFEPTGLASGENLHECSGSEWSGNFLNWASMTRMDVIRKVLYGGYRSTDTDSLTVLERTLIPFDVHAFVKTFKTTSTTQMQKFTPYAQTEISICNLTQGVGDSKNVNTANYPPLLRIAKGSWPQWAAAEVTQCQWGSGVRPSEGSHKLAELNARVQVCASGMEESNCRVYPNGSKKPVGILQRFSKGGGYQPLRFGLMTGSYQKNKSGFVLRRNIEPLIGNSTGSLNEIDENSGRFINQDAGIPGVINTLNRFRISSYSFTDKKYGRNCGSPGITSFADGECVDWGNPLGEGYLEMLRYFSGKTSATSGFSANDGDYIPGLGQVAWKDPTPQDEWCASNHAIVISTGLNSFDGDQLTNHGISGLDVADMTNKVGLLEQIVGEYLVGQVSGTGDKMCTGKYVLSLSSVAGVCPEVPNMEGGYHIAGLAKYASTTNLRPSFPGQVRLTTQAVALAESLPQFSLPLPSGGQVTILPACQANSNGSAGHFSTGWRNCSMTDVVVEDMVYSDGALVKGRLLVSWEDSSWGSDYDMDGISRLEFCRGPVACGDAGISSGQVKVTVSAQQADAGHALRFGYTITGTTNDGAHLPVLRPGGQNFSLLESPQRNPGNAPLPSTNEFWGGLSSAKLLENPLWYAAKYGTIGEWDKDGDGVPDNFHKATNPATLSASLEEILQGIAKAESTVAAIATNSTRLDTNTLIYQAKFSSFDWSGQLIAYRINADGTVGADAWDTDQSPQKIANHGVRKIFSWNGSAGIPFQWANLTTAQKAFLGSGQEGEDRLNWIRGDQSKEQPSGSLRTRTKILGDIVNSDPVYVGVSTFGYENLPDKTVGKDTYTNFVSTKYSRTKMLYVGANDGMLHAFDAESGVEKFAYIPNALFSNLASLTSPDYSHKYFVDGSAFVGDAYIKDAWRSVLVGTTGAGGKAVFALDVTNPDTFSQNEVLWEFTNNTDADLGYTIGRPVVARMQTGQWVAIFGNGYGSANGKACLYIVNLETGALIKKIDTGVSGGNGLGSPILLADGNRTITTAYAGDRRGNVWKFDLSDKLTNKWEVAFNGQPLFKAGASQPITAPLEIGRHPKGGYMVYFGTGKFFEIGDNVVDNPPVQSFYGIWDNGSAITATDRSVLQGQSILAEGALHIESTSLLRVVSANPIDWAAKRGWYLDLVFPADNPQGERVVSRPILRHGRVIFTTLIPLASPCDAGGTSWVMELDALTGGRLDYSVFDINGKDGINEQDFVTIILNGENVLVAVSGLKSDVGIIQTPAVISAGAIEYKYAGGSSGDIAVINEKGGDTSKQGRRSWRQIR